MQRWFFGCGRTNRTWTLLRMSCEKKRASMDWLAMSISAYAQVGRFPSMLEERLWLMTDMNKKRDIDKEATDEMLKSIFQSKASLWHHWRMINGHWTTILISIMQCLKISILRIRHGIPPLINHLYTINSIVWNRPSSWNPVFSVDGQQYKSLQVMSILKARAPRKYKIVMSRIDLFEKHSQDIDNASQRFLREVRFSNTITKQQLTMYRYPKNVYFQIGQSYLELMVKISKPPVTLLWKEWINAFREVQTHIFS